MAPARIKGVIKGYTTTHKEAILVNYQVFDSEQQTLNATISTMNPSKPSDGTFELEIPIRYTDRVSFSFRDKTYTVILPPGEETEITIDMKRLPLINQKKPAIVFTGSFGDFNTDLAQYGDEYESIKILEPIQSREGLNTLRGLTVSQYRDKVISLYEAAKNRLMSDKRLSGAFKQYVDATYKYQTIMKTLLYNTTLNVANETDSKIYERPDDYYDYLKTMQPFADVAYFYTMNTLSAVAMINIVKNFSNQQNLSLHPSVKQLQDAYRYMRSIAEFNELSSDDIIQLRQQCPQVYEDVLQRNEELKRKIEEAKNSKDYTIREISSSLSGEDIFKAIIAPYKGQPLLVDFWATWCGPCRAAMQTILPVKESLKGKAHFVYVSSSTSPRKTWEMTIPDIHGDHYYVTDEQYSALLKQFESDGIPTYVIVDKDGKVKSKYVGYPGNDVIEEQLK